MQVKKTGLPLSHFKELFDSVPGLYLVLNPDLEIVAVNDSYLEATMTNREEVMGRKLFEVFPDNPDDPSASGVSNLRASFKNVLESRAVHSMAVQKYDIRRPDGTFEERYWSPLNKPVLNNKGEVIYIIHRVEDVTEFVRLRKEEILQRKITNDLKARAGEMEMEIFKRAQEIQETNSLLLTEISERKKIGNALMEANEFLNAILENIPDMVFVKDAKELRFVRFNKAGEELLGYAREDLIGKNDYDFFPKDQADFFTEKDRRVLNEGNLLDISEEKINTTKGQRWLHTKKIPVMGVKGTPLFLLGISEDITERRLKDERIRELNIILEKNVNELNIVNQELESFTYSVSHDLRAPLRIIEGYIEILTKKFNDSLDEEAQRLLNVIVKNAQRMGWLIDDLLSLSRFNKMELDVHKTNMNMLVKRVGEAELIASGSKTIIKYGKLEDVNADSNLIERVWSNLISNAIKYSRNRENPKIETGSKKENDEIIYFVKDNGTGFDMRYAGKLFGVFQRLHKLSEFEGTGVGLAIVQRIVAKHGGRVWAESEVDKGATFYFTLPVL